jgi:hypothetical protein
MTELLPVCWCLPGSLIICGVPNVRSEAMRDSGECRPDTPTPLYTAPFLSADLTPRPRAGCTLIIAGPPSKSY